MDYVAEVSWSFNYLIEACMASGIITPCPFISTEKGINIEDCYYLAYC